MRETVMVELDEAFDGTPSQQADYIREKLKPTGLACEVRVAPIPNADRVLVDVEDPSRNIADLVADKLDDAGVRAYVYEYDNDTNAMKE